MNTDHIKYILKIYECKSINKAAQSLFVSQPYLSKLIKNVENEIGYNIFSRKQNGIELTSEGEIFIESVKKIKNELNVIHSVPERFKNNDSLSIVSTYSSYNLQCFIDFKRKNSLKQVQDSYFEFPFDDVVEQIIDGKSSLGLISTVDLPKGWLKQYMNERNLDIIMICETIPIKAIMSKSHPLASKKSISIEEFFKSPITFYRGFNQINFSEIPNIDKKCDFLFVSDRGSLFDVLRSGNYIAPTMEISSQQKKHSGCVCIPIDNLNIVGQTFCIKLKQHILTPRENNFINFCKDKYKCI